MMIKVRNFQKQDQDDAKEIILHGLEDHFGFIDYSLNPDLDDIEKNYVQKGHVFVVAFDSTWKEIIGTGALLIDAEGSKGEIVRVSVDKNFRRRGIGKKITQVLIQKAEKKSLSAVIVATEHDWSDALGLYRSLGFVEFDKDEVDTYLRLELSSEQSLNTKPIRR